MNENDNSNWQRQPHPDFDGHIERPLESMTMAERLDWAWRMMQFRYWAKHDVTIEHPPRAEDESGECNG